jgi:photosystem II Psb27 protein
MKSLITRLLALVLVAIVGLTGCSAGTNGTLTGDYRQDTLMLADDDPAKPAAQAEAKVMISDFASRYRRDGAVANLSSFTTMRTALNAIAGHYSAYPNRPLPEKLKTRVEQELKQVESALNRGA